MNRRTRLLLIVAGSVVGAAVLILIAVNLLISADWVRERVANRIKEQTGRELTVNGTTSLLFTPGPHVVITDAALIDPEERAGTSDFSVARLEIDLTLTELLSRNVNAERIVLERPELTLRLGDDQAEKKPKSARNKEPKPRRDVKLKNVRVEDGNVNIVYGDGGKEKRVEHITANFSLPTLTEPFTGAGKFEWKEQMVDFSFELSTFAELRQKRPARLQFALDTSALAARFDGSLLTRPEVSGQGTLSAKAHSIPSLLAWMREKPAAVTGIGDGELTSHVDWKKDEIAFNDIRFALEHANGQGQAVVGLSGARPHVRAALALDYLDLNPFLAAGREKSASKTKTSAPPESGAPERAQETGDVAQNQAAAPAPQPAASPASFDADVNLNIRKARVFHLDIGPSSAGLAFRDGVLNATLGGMELYEGHARGTLVIDAARPVPAFSGDFVLDGVQAKPLLSDAAQFSLLEGQTKLALQINGTGGNADQIKSSLQGQGSVAVSNGAIEGFDLTQMIDSLGAGEFPELQQGPGAKTKFDELGGSFTINNGIAETDNLTVKSPRLKIDAAGTVNIPQSTIDMLAEPEIVAGAEGQDGANELAGLSVPVRIEGPLDRPTVKPQVKELLADPEKAGKAVNKIGKALQKKFKGKPVGEAIGGFLGGIKIESRGDDSKKKTKQAKPDADAGAGGGAEPKPEPVDPDIERILR